MTSNKQNMVKEIFSAINESLKAKSIFNKIYRLNGSHYKEMDYAQLERLVSDLYLDAINQTGGNATSLSARDIIYFIRTSNAVPEKDINPKNKYPFLNGILEFREGKTFFSPREEEIFTFCSSISYDETASTKSVEIAKAFLNTIVPREKEQKYLLESLAFAMFPILTQYINFDVFMFLFGTGANGKSVLLNMLHSIFGDDATCAVTLEKISSRFGSVALVGKRLNLASENIQRSIKEDPTLKAITSGDYIEVEQKYMPRFRAQIFIVNLFSLNKEPILADASYAIKRRTRVINFPNRFIDNPSSSSANEFKANPALRDPLSPESLEIQQGLLHLIIQTAKELFERKTLTETDLSLIDEMQKNTSHLHQFLAEYFDWDKNNMVPSGDVFLIYKEFCTDEGHFYEDKLLDPHEFDKACRTPGQLTRRLRELYPERIYKERNNDTRYLKGLVLNKKGEETLSRALKTVTLPSKGGYISC